MKLEQSVDHVIFDLDGVLLDTEPVYMRATSTVAARYGKVFDWSIKRNAMGRSAIDAGRYIVEALDLPLTPEAFVAARAAILHDLWPTIDAIPGAEAFTRELAGRGVAMAIATSTDSALFEIKAMRHRSWLAALTIVVCGDDRRVTRAKPAPDIFLAAAADLGAEPHRCVVLEDSPAGVIAGLAAGMQVVAIPDSHLDRTAVAGAQLVVDGFAALRPDDLGF